MRDKSERAWVPEPTVGNLFRKHLPEGKVQPTVGALEAEKELQVSSWRDKKFNAVFFNMVDCIMMPFLPCMDVHGNYCR